MVDLSIVTLVYQRVPELAAMIVKFLIVLWEHGAIIPLNMAGLSKAVAHEIAGANFPGSSLARDRREYLNTHTHHIKCYKYGHDTKYKHVNKIK